MLWVQDNNQFTLKLIQKNFEFVKKQNQDYGVFMRVCFGERDMLQERN